MYEEKAYTILKKPSQKQWELHRVCFGWINLLCSLVVYFKGLFVYLFSKHLTSEIFPKMASTQCPP